MAGLVTFNDTEIRKFTKNFSEGRQIGTAGAFGQVYKGRIKGEQYQNCPRKVAVKISKSNNEYQRIMWQQEVNALSSIFHDNIIRLVGYGEENHLSLVYERAKQDLEGYVASSKDELDSILLGAALGLEAIHSAGFVHWDFQPRNVLLMKDKTVKIADFGLATRIDEKMVFFNDRRRGYFNENDTEDAKEKFDVFCFGNFIRHLVLNELAMSKKKWSPTKTPRRLLSDDCTRNDPNERPSMHEVVSRLQEIQKDQ